MAPSCRGSFVHPLSRLRRGGAAATPLPAGLGRLWTTGSHCGWSLSVRNGRRGERERGAPSGELSRSSAPAAPQQRLMAPSMHGHCLGASWSWPTLSDWLPP